MRKRSFFCFLLIINMIMVPVLQAYALQAGTLTFGSKGSSVVKLQQALIDLGYLNGTADGKFGKLTEAAVKAFQSANKLKVDGLAGSSTQSKLYAAIASGSSAVTQAPSASQQSSSSASGSTSSSGEGISFGSNYATLRYGSSGNRVTILQKGLISLGFLSGKADGKFGKQTQTAVRSFQSNNKLTVDGLAGKKTLQTLEKASSSTSSTSSSSSSSSTASGSGSTSVSAGSTTYTKLNKGTKGTAVTSLQQKLKELNYSVSVTGTYDEATRLAVIAFQQRNALAADGIAGQLTQTKLYSGNCVSGDASIPTLEEGLGRITPPAASELKLLHWFNDIKPSIKTGQSILVYDPSTGLGWNLKLYSLGRHADSEPLSLQDTQIMEKAFGGENTWNQKAVWVRLPSGTWTIASTHDMPHLNGSIKDNGFNGHLCVHFLRDMSEAEKNDPNYGVDNQKTIRKAWKELTGQEISY